MARTSALSGLSVADLEREIAKRGRLVSKLRRQRAGLARRLAALDAKIAANGGGGGGGARRGARRAGSGLGMGAATRQANAEPLQNALAKVLKGKTMSVTDMAQAVQKAGYRTHSPNFRVIVNAVMLKHKKMFRRVSRGKYTAV